MGDEGGGDLFGFKEIIENKRLWRALIAEFAGTFFVVLIGTGTVIVVGEVVDMGPIVRIAFAFGFAISSVMKSISHVSGGHINPAITLSFLVSGDIKVTKALIYMIFQCAAAIAASGLLWLITPPSAKGNLGATLLDSKVSVDKGTALEGILTFMVAMLFHGVMDQNRIDLKGSPALAIGLAYTAAHMCGVSWTGCSLNPARSLGPAVLSNTFNDFWIYIVGPCGGGILAGLFYRLVLTRPIEE